MILHAGFVALRLRGFWRGVLIRGPSGAGKSDLALRALDAGFRLVADDRVIVWKSGGLLYGRAPSPIAGAIEVRGHGVTPEPSLGLAEAALVADCVRSGADVERMPESETTSLLGLRVALVRIDPLEASAPAKLRRALQHLGHKPQQAYQARSSGGGDRLGTGDTL
ncbi:MAG TPA: HPr kinase/phosphorylase [Caulobacteraceae bacterium]|nr:HPr kinase/phosphorylase [Caulobacteraceae bacterium]